MSGAWQIGIVVPVAEELAPYRELLAGWRRVAGTGPWELYAGGAGASRVVVIVSDCGPVNAGAATERLITTSAPTAILHGGSAGAHTPDLLPGDVVVGSSTCILFPASVQEARRERGLHPKGIRFRKDGRRVHVDRCEADPLLLALAERVARDEVERLGPWAGPGWPDGIPRRAAKATVGGIGSADAWSGCADVIAQLRTRYETAAEDMESAFVAQVCALHGVPFLAVRAISNNDLLRPLETAEITESVSRAGWRAASVLVRVAAALPPP